MANTDVATTIAAHIGSHTRVTAVVMERAAAVTVLVHEVRDGKVIGEVIHAGGSTVDVGDMLAIPGTRIHAWS